MKAISQLRKPKRKSNMPYKLKTTIQNYGRAQKTESAASNESAVEQIQGAASEAVYHAAQVPPQIRYAVRKYQRKIANERQREQEQTIAQRTAEHGRRRFQKNVQKQAIQQAQTAGKSAGVILEKAGTALIHAVKSMASYLAASLGAVGLVMILSLVLLVAAVAASPFGIFLANEPSPNTIPLSSAVAQINMELNERFMDGQDGDYKEIEIHGTQPKWTEVIAVFAAHVAGAEDGVSVAQLDAERVELLRDTFWDMCSISSRIETEEIPTIDPGEPTKKPEETLHITILSKSATRMCQIYRFNDFQNEALDALLAEEEMLLAIPLPHSLQIMIRRLSVLITLSPMAKVPFCGFMIRESFCRKHGII